MAKFEGVVKYQEMKKKHNITDEQIKAWAKGAQNNKFVKHGGDILVLPWLFAVFSILCCQLCCCSLPCLYSKGCCCFKKCSGYKKKGTIDEETNEIYICYKDYLKFGLDPSNPLIIETTGT